jgi:hypothetical protein
MIGLAGKPISPELMKKPPDNAYLLSPFWAPERE